jgi:hypothetical protein
MREPRQVVEYFQSAAYAYLMANNTTLPSQGGVHYLNAHLNAIAEAADGAEFFNATCSDGKPALVVVCSSDLTVYRLDANKLETLSFGTPRNGRLIEVIELPATEGASLGRADFTYSSPALEAIGGELTIDVGPLGAQEADRARDALLTLTR